MYLHRISHLALAAILASACGGPPAGSTTAHHHHHAPAAHGERPSEPFRREHAHFLERLEQTEQEALALSSDAPAEEQRRHIDAVLAFLHDELMPHAGAEEAVLYPVADRVAGTPAPLRYTDVLRYEHTVVHDAVATLDAWERAGDRSPEAIASFQRRVVELVGLVRGHFGGEENVVLALLDERMSADELRAEVLVPMEAWLAEHGGGHAVEHDAHE